MWSTWASTAWLLLLACRPSGNVFREVLGFSPDALSSWPLSKSTSSNGSSFPVPPSFYCYKFSSPNSRSWRLVLAGCGWSCLLLLPWFTNIGSEMGPCLWPFNGGRLFCCWVCNFGMTARPGMSGWGEWLGALFCTWSSSKRRLAFSAFEFYPLWRSWPGDPWFSAPSGAFWTSPVFAFPSLPS